MAAVARGVGDLSDVRVQALLRHVLDAVAEKTANPHKNVTRPLGGGGLRRYFKRRIGGLSRGWRLGLWQKTVGGLDEHLVW